MRFWGASIPALSASMPAVEADWPLIEATLEEIERLERLPAPEPKTDETEA